ncbi:MAG: DUF1304 domain-containing protein [Bacteriovoracia bacterium]
MHLVSNIFVGFVAIEHLMFLYMEMFLWTKPLMLKRFEMTASYAASTASLAKNMGLYNGFLGAGLIWSLFTSDPVMAHSLKMFFLVCAFIAGIFGGLTAFYRILFVQAFPAGIALIFIKVSGA